MARTTRGRRRHRGGANQLVLPATVENASYESSLSSPSKMMLNQGTEYQSIHAGQHGGAVAVNLAPAPPGFTGVLENGLRSQAWLNPLDASMEAIQGMSDQSGGRRRRGRKSSRRGRKSSRRGRKSSRRTKKQGGGATSLSHAQDFGAPGMLLSPGQEAKALESMNPEWKLATNPSSFTPR
jgi:hypothetical protein